MDMDDDMENFRKKVLTATQTIRNRYSEPIPIGIMTGTGLSELPNGFLESCSFDYSQLPHFPVSTVEGHSGQLTIGTLAHKTIIIMQGRFHLYEGYSPQQVVFPVRVMQELGVTTLIVNNAAGGINPHFSPGDIMLINDHVNLTGHNPLIGPNSEKWGIRFPDMSAVYSQKLIKLALQESQKNDIPIQQGVYAGLLGPSLETPAEIRFLKTIGCDAVGLSTVMEVIAAVHADMDVLGLSLVTNVHDPDHPTQTTLESVLSAAQKSVPKLNRLMGLVIKQMS